MLCRFAEKGKRSFLLYKEHYLMLAAPTLFQNLLPDHCGREQYENLSTQNMEYKQQLFGHYHRLNLDYQETSLF